MFCDSTTIHFLRNGCKRVSNGFWRTFQAFREQGFLFFFLVNVFDVIDSPHTHCSTFAATPKPPVPKATLMETQRAETKQDLSQSDLVWPFWSNTLIWHDANKVTNHGFCTHCLFLDLKLSETLSDDDTEQLI